MALRNHSSLHMNFWALSPHPDISPLSMGYKSVQHGSVWVPGHFGWGIVIRRRSVLPFLLRTSGTSKTPEKLCPRRGASHQKSNMLLLGWLETAQFHVRFPHPPPRHAITHLKHSRPTPVLHSCTATTCGNSRRVATRGLGNWGMLSQGTNLQLVDK